MVETQMSQEGEVVPLWDVFCSGEVMNQIFWNDPIYSLVILPGIEEDSPSL